MSVTRDRYLQKARARLRTFLRETTCTISMKTGTTGITGAPTNAVVVVVSDVLCRLIEGKSDTIDIGDQHNITETYTLVLPLDTIIEIGYFVTIDNKKYKP